MDKLTEALKSLIPEDQLQDVAKAVEEMIAESKASLEDEYNSKLNEAYEQLENEKRELEEGRETGYQQAYAIIDDLQKRLELQREEFENHMEEQYEEAYKVIEAERASKDDVQLETYKEYDEKLKEMKDFMVDKVDQFLRLQNAELYEHAKRDVLNDPRTLEHKVAFDKITDIVADRLSDEEFSSVTSSKLEESQRQIDDLKAHLRVLESKNTRLTMNNNKLNEAVREQKNMLTEANKNQQVVERKERAESAKNASGRGHRVMETDQIISEFNNPETNQPNNNGNEDEVLIENDQLNELLVLSGVKTDRK